VKGTLIISDGSWLGIRLQLGAVENRYTRDKCSPCFPEYMQLCIIDNAIM